MNNKLTVRVMKRENDTPRKKEETEKERQGFQINCNVIQAENRITEKQKTVRKRERESERLTERQRE